MKPETIIFAVVAGVILWVVLRKQPVEVTVPGPPTASPAVGAGATDPLPSIADLLAGLETRVGNLEDSEP